MIFESTKNFTQSGIHTVIPLLRKILCDKSVWNGFGTQGDPEGVKYRDVFHQSKSLRDHLAPWREMRAKGLLCLFLALPDLEAAGVDHYNNFSDYITHVSVYTSVYTHHFSPEPHHVNDLNMLGAEMRLVNKWLYGFTLFDNSFGQESQYLYTGYQWNISRFSSYASMRQHIKVTGGLLHGYKDEYQDKIPFNGLGVAPAIVPTYGLKYKNLIAEASLGGVSAFTITVGYSF